MALCIICLISLSLCSNIPIKAAGPMARCINENMNQMPSDNHHACPHPPSHLFCVYFVREEKFKTDHIRPRPPPVIQGTLTWIVLFTISRLKTVFRSQDMAQKLSYKQAFHAGLVLNWQELVESCQNGLKISGFFLVRQYLHQKALTACRLGRERVSNLSNIFGTNASFEFGISWN